MSKSEAVFTYGAVADRFIVDDKLQRSHCKNGHALTSDVVYWYDDKMKCGVCREAARQRWKRR